VLNNVARHAKASRAWVNLRLGEAGTRVEIGDDGLGFEGEGGGEHFGLLVIRERADAIGARFRVVTGRGSVVTVEGPSGQGEGDHV
jgi:signal transduction histidine kinase